MLRRKTNLEEQKSSLEPIYCTLG